MDPVSNPYSPGAGRPPASLVGRDRQRDGWRVSLDRVAAGRLAAAVRQDTRNQADGPTVRLADARPGVERGREALDDGFRARRDRSTRGEQTDLRAMSQDGDVDSASGQIGARLGGAVGSLGPARANPTTKGLVPAESSSRPLGSAQGIRGRGQTMVIDAADDRHAEGKGLTR